MFDASEQTEVTTIAGGDFAKVLEFRLMETYTYVVYAYDLADHWMENGATVFIGTDHDEACDIGWWWDNWLEDCYNIGRDPDYKRRLPD